ncbi:MAG: methyltransferase [Tannerella sp.]|nr:methyltransferase [Tannerella sp.]
MSNSYFRFKQFTVHHDRCAMKVGTDGVLLGAWANVSDCRTALDIGAGTGLISLMIAQRNPSVRMDAIEIDADACEQAEENIAASPFAAQITLYHADFCDYASTCRQHYDLIISNPPYFSEAVRCPDSRRQSARHDDGLPLSALIEKSVPLLTPTGRIALILPFAQETELLQQAEKCRLHCIRRTDVIPVEGATPKRLLAELGTISCSAAEKNRLILEDSRRRRTMDYRLMTKDFYLYD